MHAVAASALAVAALARKLSRTSSDAAVTLLRSIREQHGLAEVSAEAAELASRRSLPLVKLPAVLEAEVDAVLAEQGVTTREAGRLAADIRDRFKKLSNSPHRGGLTPVRSRPASTGPNNTRLFPRHLRVGSVTPGRQPRLRGAELAAAREALEAGDLGGLSGAQLNAALGLPPPLVQDERLAEFLKKIAPSYKSMDQVLGYLVARFTPEYAACRRVLQEAAGLMSSRVSLAGADPATGAAAGGGGGGSSGGGGGRGAWPPREVLVHGAGTGAAVVAALEALPRGSLKSVVAVEESIARQTLGTRLERRYRQHAAVSSAAAAAAVAAAPEAARAVTGTGGSSADISSSSGGGGGGTGGTGGGAIGTGPVSGASSQGAWRQRGASRAALAQADGGGQAGAGGGWPRVSWLRSLAPLHKSPGAQRKRYDLVIAPYQLAVLPTLEAKLALVRQLWERCGGALVLVEPGTPAGFGDVAEARELLLALETRRGQQLAAALARGDARAAAKLAGAGAHVVAPCPHDGACPLWKAGRRTWCHFEQPLLRPDFMRDTADRRPPGAPPPRRVGARDKQDERFSYLVIRRGPRPQQRVAVARAYAAAPPPPPHQQQPLAAAAVRSGNEAEPGAAAVAAAAAAGLRLPQRAVLMQVLMNRMAAGSAAGAQDAGDAGGSGPSAGARGLARMPLFDPDADRGASVEGPQGPDAAAVTAAAASGEGTPTAAPASGGTRSTVIRSGHVSGSSSGVNRGVSPAVADFARKYPAYGPGLVGRLLALQDAGVDWAAASQEASAPDAEEGEQEPELLERAAAQAAAAAVEGVATSANAGSSSGGGSSSTSSTVERATSGGTTSHRPGLDAALAQMALMSLAPAAGRGSGAGSGAGQEVMPLSEKDAEALRAALLQKAAVAAAANGQVEDLGEAVRATEELKAGMGSSSGGSGSGATGEDGDGEGGGRVARLSRKDVSDQEYAAAEAQLLQRVYWGSSQGAFGSGSSSSSSSAAAARDDSNSGNNQSGNDSDRESDSDSDSDDEGEGAAANPFKPQLHASETASPPPDLGLALASSYGWGRLLRPPRRRGGHVVLDLCMGPQQQYVYGDVPYVPPPLGAVAGAEGAAGAAGARPERGGPGEAEDGQQRQQQEQQQVEEEEEESTAGRTVQQVVARSARKSWMGVPAYRMARQLGWGDVWPDWFARAHTAREVGPAPAAAAAAPADRRRQWQHGHDEREGEEAHREESAEGVAGEQRREGPKC
ncbi:hypothetical protein HYH02_010169 [Chlamydomonas schloesseri]|uniref:Mitochondrial small ribosomal subunit Rsm22 n=1 Tax=Chlamydomonas schloesseri TaxID=2026947 RepID=A0A835T8E3_9CHLO|nr:hypothetical protein HYH02_010169 [Chlamydomonas schloesseri]|eukprot:KAG2440588.1 hypothetical protein HYH02_010169 [Chlamydomonas schloesseri]